MNPADPFGLVGQVLDGQFRVDKLVGEGGFSVVYRGHHQGLNEPIAIKCLKLPAALGTSLVDTFVQRFRDESRILYRLSQGNLHVVRSVAAGTTQAPVTGAIIPYMVLEWLEGRSLQNDFTVRRTVGETGRTLEEVVKLFDTAADGLAYAHAQGVVHRDLNPGNLYLATTPQGVKMKVLDFGVAKIMHDGALNLGPRAQTVGQIRIFAPAYGAPEQFDDRVGAVGAWSDVYAFALVLLEALRDRSVNEGTHLGEFASSATDPKKRPTPRSLGVDVPDEVEAAFARATVLDPKARWQSAGDFWKSLTIAMKVASEHKYEKAARETPPLAMGTRPEPAKKMAATMPLGSAMPNIPGLPPKPRPRTPTAIGIPPVRPGAAPAPPPAAVAPPPAPVRNTPRPPAPSNPGFTAIPRPARPPSNRPAAAPAPAPANAPATARFPSAPEVPPAEVPTAPPAPPLEDEQEEATRVHAPAAEVLRTLALADAQAARAAVDQALAGTDQDALADAARAAAPGSTRSRVAAPAAPPPERPSPVPPAPPSGAGSGGTMMMAPGDAQAARAQVAKQQSLLAQQAQQQQQQQQQPPPQQPPHPHGNLGSTLAMAPPVAGYSASAPPPQPQAPAMPAPGMQGIPGAHGTPPQGVPALSTPPLVSHTPPAPFGTPPPPFAQQRPSAEHAPFPPPPPSFAGPAPEPPTKPLPIVPIAVGFAVLALGGLGLGIYAVSSRSATTSDAGAVVASASDSASLTPVPVPVPTESAAAAPAPTATEEVDAGTAAAAAETEDASTAAVAEAASAVATTAPIATAAATAVQFTPAPTTAPPPPTASAKPPEDPNAWNEGAARAKLGIANGVLVICKKDGSVTGPGTAMVTFSTDGTVTGVVLAPPFAGTPAGDCVAAQLRRAKVNPFTGTSHTVQHAFDVPK